ncbi:MAG TPA: alpha-amylase [Verrucomicrobiota bacterium]|nr:alpha-amylase [Verrucomicrobiota bacterium]HNU52531.1 alpha-amylase [Verrucomicrobiota bacterium]
MRHPLVYEIHLRSWLRRLSVACGRSVTLGRVPEEEFERWAGLGFTHVWLMGVWPTGPKSRAVALADDRVRAAAREALPDVEEADILGSPFAVAEYRVPREGGGDAGLRRFRKQLHRHGIGLLLDFIPNQVGLDHPWLGTAPQRFVALAAGAGGGFDCETAGGVVRLAHGRDPNFPPWADTVQLDYRLEETRGAVLGELESVADRCDGVRCDLAMLVLNEVFERTWGQAADAQPMPAREFWSEAIASIKRRRRDFLFLAEAYWNLEARLQHLGFDYTYDKRLYDLLLARDFPAVQRHLVGKPLEYVSAGAHFLENHDEPRIASLLSPTEHAAAAWVTLGLPGLRLLHDGQPGGLCLPAPIHLGREPVETPQADLAAMYERFLGVMRESAVGQGEARVLMPRPAWNDNPTWQHFVVVAWRGPAPQWDLVVVNLAPHPGQCYVPLPIADLGDCNWRMRDLLGAECYERYGEDLQNQGLYLDVGANGVQLFRFEPV